MRMRVIVQKGVRIPYTTVKSNRRSIYRIRMIGITANGPLNAFEHRGRKWTPRRTYKRIREKLIRTGK